MTDKKDGEYVINLEKVSHQITFDKNDPWMQAVWPKRVDQMFAEWLKLLREPDPALWSPYTAHRTNHGRDHLSMFPYQDEAYKPALKYLVKDPKEPYRCVDRLSGHYTIDTPYLRGSRLNSVTAALFPSRLVKDPVETSFTHPTASWNPSLDKWGKF